jgi:hypothetical protein
MFLNFWTGWVDLKKPAHATVFLICSGKYPEQKIPSKTVLRIRIPDPDFNLFRIPDRGSRIPDLGSRISDPGSRISDPGSRISDPGSRISDPESKNSNKREG